jgi:hypothetical protein
MKQLNRVLPVFAVLALLVTVNSFAAKMDMHTSSQFQGPKANTGTVTHYVENGKSMLKVSDDFKVPDTPAPTWRVVDSKGVVYTLDAFKIKSGNNEKREVVVPSYVPNIAKVQVYCAWAEVRPVSLPPSNSCQKHCLFLPSGAGAIRAPFFHWRDRK